MTDNPDMPASKRPVWIRGLYMLLMAVLWHVAEVVLWIVVVIQFVLALVSDVPNERLSAFGRSLGSYVRQIVHFLTFATEEVPFPFSEWPAD